MRDITVKNRELISMLSPFVSFLQRDIETFQRCFALHGSEQSRNRHWWTGEKYLKELQDDWTNHEGYPDMLHAYDLKTREHDHLFSDKATPQEKTDLRAELIHYGNTLVDWLGCKNTALIAYYPPGGFISWHNNANAAAYNIVFTWSETGEGRFQYVDPTTKEIVTMQDKMGWQCKAGYFGSHNEEDKIFWHTAKTDCWRITLSFMFTVDKLSEEIREDLLEEIAIEE